MQGKRILSDRQIKILHFIKEFHQNYHCAPSYREIAEATGLKSSSSVAYQLNYLQENNFISRLESRGRTIEVASDEDSDRFASNLKSIPLVGQIAAGLPITAEQNIDDTLLVSDRITGSGELFSLVVKGDSMIDAGIFEGDYIVVRRQNEAQDGDIVAAMLESDSDTPEATVKVFQKQRNANGTWKIRLLPCNSAYEPIEIDPDNGQNFTIIGKVVSVLRRL